MDLLGNTRVGGNVVYYYLYVIKKLFVWVREKQDPELEKRWLRCV